jgi:FKBP-type peptidyl-prolyl cis-trans isomerase FklB
MHKISIAAVILFAAGMLLPGTTVAQTPAATTQTGTQSASGSSQSAPAKSPASAKSHSATASKSVAPLSLKTQKDKFSYAIGMKMGESYKKGSIAVDPSILARGMRDALAGNKTLLTDEEAQATITAERDEMMKKQQATMQQEGGANEKAGEAFLAANKNKDGVKVLPSGLQYKILKEGTGPKPTANDKVTVNYRGTLIDGKEFDSSYKRGQPITFPVTGVIKGWTEALQLMPVGSKWELFIPANLAYGERGAGGDIGPNETLIFEVELLSIVKEQNPGENQEKK